MRRNFSYNNRFPGYYRQDYLNKLRAEMSVNEFSRRAKMNLDTAQRVFRGTASAKQVWRAARHLKAVWILVHDLDRSTSELLDLHRAALNGTFEVRAVIRAARGSGGPRHRTPELIQHRGDKSNSRLLQK